MTRLMTHKQPSFQLSLRPKASGIPSYQWLRDSLRTEILSGMLRPGQRMPGTRELARLYKLSRGTVLSAIEDLKSEGYLHGVSGSGTFISNVLPDQLLQNKTPPAQGELHQQSESPRLSEYAKRIRPINLFYNPQSLAFRTNLPALDLFPTTLWAKVMGRRLRQTSSNQLLGCEARGYLPLRKVLAQYLRTARGVRCEPEQIVMVSGIQEALDLVARLLLNPGDRVLVEDPGYIVANIAFTAVGAKSISIPIDEKGAAPSRQDFRNARLMYVTPGHQFPTGVTMPISRRLEILQYAREAKTFILEDDYDSEYRYSGSPIPAMQGIDKENLVIFAGSFNKVLFPSLRMGYIVLPPSLLEPFVLTKAMISRHHSVLDQLAVCDFIEEGHFGRHLRRMRHVYAERLEALSYHMQKQLSDVMTLSPIEAGLQTMAWLKPGLLAEDLGVAAAERKIDVVPLSRYCLQTRLPEGIQIGFAAIDEATIAKGVSGLAAAARSLKSRTKKNRANGLP
jgi:GntR family transcriptional regulator / MocR family aminotransferase